MAEGEDDTEHDKHLVRWCSSTRVELGALDGDGGHLGDAVALGNIFGAPIEEVRFARDSPLEERVSSEPVSEVRFSGLAIRHDSERFMDDNRSGKGYFGLENGGISVFAPWQLLLLS